MGKPKKLTLPLTILLVISVIFSLYYYLDYNGYLSLLTEPPSSQIKVSPSISASPSPTLPARSPYPLIPDSGTAGTYNVSQPLQPGPEFTHITIDPIDAQLNQTVTVTVTLNHAESITSVRATIETDQKPLNLNLNFISQNGTSQTWQGAIVLSEPILYKYVYHFTAISSSGVTELPMALRN